MREVIIIIIIFFLQICYSSLCEIQIPKALLTNRKNKIFILFLFLFFCYLLIALPPVWRKCVQFANRWL